jgi:hypothetical protein
VEWLDGKFGLLNAGFNVSPLQIPAPALKSPARAFESKIPTNFSDAGFF